MPRVFISHSSSDRSFVEGEIIPLLQPRGVETWYSGENIEPASQFENEIKEGLRACDWFLVVLSPSAVESEWVKCEVDWAINNRRGRIIPLMLKTCSPVDLHLRLPPLQHIDFRSDKEKARQKLLAKLTGAAPPPIVRERRPRALRAAAAAVGLLLIILATLYSLYSARINNPSPNGGTQATNSAHTNAVPAASPGGNLTIGPHVDNSPNRR